MPTIKSIEDLKKVRQEANTKRQQEIRLGQVRILLGMGTPGIAMGAKNTLKAIQDFIEKEKLANVVVVQTGNFGLDYMEPVVRVVVGEEPQVTYGKVTPEAARQILREHVMGGNIVQQFLVEP